MCSQVRFLIYSCNLGFLLSWFHVPALVGVCIKSAWGLVLVFSRSKVAFRFCSACEFIDWSWGHRVETSCGIDFSK